MAEPLPPVALDVVDAGASSRLNGSGHAHVPMDLGEQIVQAVADGLRPVLRKLEERIAELEKRPMLEDAGVWQERAVYRPGQVTTYKGSAWVCRQANSNERPGKSDVWRLMVKSEQR